MSCFCVKVFMACALKKDVTSKSEDNYFYILFNQEKILCFGVMKRPISYDQASIVSLVV